MVVTPVPVTSVNAGSDCRRKDEHLAHEPEAGTKQRTYVLAQSVISCVTVDVTVGVGAGVTAAARA